jgi:hypothetical protein
MLDGIKQLTPLLAEGVQGAAAVLIGLAAIQAVLGSWRLFVPGIPVRTGGGQDAKEVVQRSRSAARMRA